MKHRIGKMIVLVLIVLSLGSIIFYLSSRIESQMEQSAVKNVREIVKVIEESVTEIRSNDVSAALQQAEFFPPRRIPSAF